MPPKPKPATAADASTAEPSFDGHDDAAAVQAARRGDRAAFARLHARHAPMVHGIALARGLRGESHDIVQETFAIALDRLATLRDVGAFGPWVAMIARNLATESHRQRRLRLHVSIGEVAQAAAPAADVEHAHRLLDVMCSLPEAYAETLVLRLVEGLTGPQIAACTGMTHGSVRVNLTRGMQMLRVRLKELHIDPEDCP